MIRKFLILILVLLWSSNAIAGDVILRWDENANGLATGSNPRYKIYYRYGQTSNNVKVAYGGLVSVLVADDEDPSPTVVQVTVTGLDLQLRYFFTVTALYDSGCESDLSYDISNKYIEKSKFFRVSRRR